MGVKVYLKLEDGTIFYGFGSGYLKDVSGEIVFNTGMTGYPETITDPSYYGQILVFSYPLIGNFGIPSLEKKDNLLLHFETNKIYLKAIIVAEFSDECSHKNSKQSFSQWLYENKIPLIYGIDTRELIKKIRKSGAMKADIITGFKEPETENSPFTSQEIFYKRGKKKVVLIDCGVKNSILRELISQDISVLKVPFNSDFTNIETDGYLLSNGPGNPEEYDCLIKNVKKIIKKDKPILGICLGSQILGLANGAEVYKLKYGHRSHNQPCFNKKNNKSYLTSQNHGYAINIDKLSTDWDEWFYNLNDGSNEGIIHKYLPFYGVQFHPEGNPGPYDTRFIFENFIKKL